MVGARLREPRGELDRSTRAGYGDRSVRPGVVAGPRGAVPAWQEGLGTARQVAVAGPGAEDEAHMPATAAWDGIRTKRCAGLPGRQIP
jgi:hypothetical protein